MPQPPTTAMNLVLPTDLGDNGAWAPLLDAALGLVDAHDHTTGRGVLVPVAGLNLNADIDFAGLHGVKNAITFDMAPVSAATVTAYRQNIWVNSGDGELYWTTSGGAAVKITSGTGINVSLVGGIGGDYASVGALLSFVDASDAYIFQQQVGSAVRQFARVQHADLDLYEYKAQPTAGVPANRVRHKSPASLAASYDLTWLTALPVAQSIIQVDTSGQISASNTLANNANLKLQGTGYLQHGNRKITVPLLPGVVSTGGTVSFSTGTSGASVPATTTARFPLFGVPGNARIQSVTVNLGNTALTATYTLETSDLTGAGGAYTAVPGATATTNATTTLTPTTPAVPADGFCSWIKVATGAGATAIVLSFTVTYDVP